MSIWSIFRLFGIFYDTLEYFVVICGMVDVPRFGILCREKSDNPGWDAFFRRFDQKFKAPWIAIGSGRSASLCRGPTRKLEIVGSQPDKSEKTLLCFVSY
jgi:hypothetical protein